MSLKMFPTTGIQTELKSTLQTLLLMMKLQQIDSPEVLSYVKSSLLSTDCKTPIKAKQKKKTTVLFKKSSLKLNEIIWWRSVCMKIHWFSPCGIRNIFSSWKYLYTILTLIQHYWNTFPKRDKAFYKRSNIYNFAYQFHKTMYVNYHILIKFFMWCFWNELNF